MDWIYYLLLLAALIAGLFINILGLPGLWVMVASTAAFAWGTGMDVYVGKTVLICLFVLALVAEFVEFFAGSVGAKRAGASKLGMLGAVIGAMVGAIIGTPILPIIGTIIGACVGSFAGAAGVELLRSTHPTQAVFIGVGAAKGRFLGIMLKSLFGCAILITSAIAALPIHASRPAAAPSTMPVGNVKRETLNAKKPFQHSEFRIQNLSV